MANGYFKLLRSTASQPYRFNLHASNHEVILRSVNYASTSEALNDIRSVRENASNYDRYEWKLTTDGQFMFNFTVGNRQVIGTSERYRTQQGRETGMRAVEWYAPTADLRDET